MKTEVFQNQYTTERYREMKIVKYIRPTQIQSRLSSIQMNTENYINMMISKVSGV